MEDSIQDLNKSAVSFNDTVDGSSLDVSNQNIQLDVKNDIDNLPESILPETDNEKTDLKNEHNNNNPIISEIKNNDEKEIKEIDEVKTNITANNDKNEKSNDISKEDEELLESRKTVSFFQLWKIADTRLRILVFIGCFMRVASGALHPCAFVIMGQILNTFGTDDNFFDMNGTEFAAYLRLNDIDLLSRFSSSILRLVYLGIGLYVAQFVSHVCLIYTSETQAKWLREAYAAAIIRQEIGWHDQAKEGSLVTRLALDTQLVQDGTGEHVGEMFHAISAFIAGLIIAFIFSWKMAFVMVSILPLLIVIGAYMGIIIKRNTQQTQSALAHAGKISEQAFYGIRTVFAFHLQERFTKLFNNRLKEAERLDRIKGLIFGIGIGAFFFILYEIFALSFWYGSRLVRSGQIDGSDVLVVFFAMLIGVMSLITLPTSIQNITGGMGAAYSIYKVIDRVPDIDSFSDEGHKADTCSGDIVLKDVVFKYPTRPDVTVLKNVSLNIKPGSNVAFVGASGSGKSTIISLLQRWYDIESGSITLDGVEIRDWCVSNLRNHIGLVGQEPVLFNMSIRDNILMGSKDLVSEERLIEVCKMANCHSFIESLPQSYDTNVGEHGGMLSGGQKQRIAIARALLKDPEILLLDEATSALDTASERIVQKALDNASKNRTTITVAHRLSTIKNCDIIYVVGEGNIIEFGSHEELVAREGVYYDLVQKQRIKQLQDRKKMDVSTEDRLNVPTEDESLPEVKAAEDSLLVSGILPEQIEDSEIVRVIYGEDGKIRLPTLEEMTEAANNRRKDELKRIKHQKETGKSTFFYLKKVAMVVSDKKLLFSSGILGAILAGCVAPAVSLCVSRDVVLMLSPNINDDFGSLEGPNLYSFIISMLAIVAFVGFAAQLTAFEVLGSKLTRRLRVILFASLIRKETAFFDQDEHSTGTLTALIATDCANVTVMVSRAWGEVTQFVSCIICGLIISFCYAANVTGIILLIAPLVAFASFYRSRAYEGFESKSKKAYEEASDSASEAIKEIRTVSALDRQHWFVNRYSASLKWPHILSVSHAFRDAIAVAFNGSSNMFLSAVAFYAGVRLMQDGHVTFQSMFIALMVIMNTAQTVGRSASFTSTFLKGRMGAIVVYNLVDYPTKIDPYQDGFVPGSRPDEVLLKGDIDSKLPEDIFGDNQSMVNMRATSDKKKTEEINTEILDEKPFVPKFKFKDIGFRYPSRPKQRIFDGKFNLDGPATKTIALVGPSGCGKSTTVGMIQRWYEPFTGTVSVNDIPIQNYNLEKIRSRMALVGQEPILFDASIRENISWGLPSLALSGRTLSDKELEDVANKSNIKGFIKDLPQGFDTSVGDKGSQLSGGQKQRIAIARALIRNPQILLLDEATSALDSSSEKIVQSAIDEAAKGRTTIVIAHRLSTIQDADVIAVINSGEVVELGTHFELLEKAGIYAGLVKEQNLGVEALA